MGSIDDYHDLVLSVPWLKEFINTHPRLDYELKFAGDRSFSEKAMQSFTADMKLRGKESLVDEVAKIQKGVSLLVVEYRTWLMVLPDKRVVLWRLTTLTLHTCRKMKPPRGIVLIKESASGGCFG